MNYRSIIPKQFIKGLVGFFTLITTIILAYLFFLRKINGSEEQKNLKKNTTIRINPVINRDISSSCEKYLQENNNKLEYKPEHHAIKKNCELTENSRIHGVNENDKNKQRKHLNGNTYKLSEVPYFKKIQRNLEDIDDVCMVSDNFKKHKEYNIRANVEKIESVGYNYKNDDLYETSDAKKNEKICVIENRMCIRFGEGVKPQGTQVQGNRLENEAIIVIKNNKKDCNQHKNDNEITVECKYDPHEVKEENSVDFKIQDEYNTLKQENHFGLNEVKKENSSNCKKQKEYNTFQGENNFDPNEVKEENSCNYKKNQKYNALPDRDNHYCNEVKAEDSCNRKQLEEYYLFKADDNSDSRAFNEEKYCIFDEPDEKDDIALNIEKFVKKIHPSKTSTPTLKTSINELQHTINVSSRDLYENDLSKTDQCLHGRKNKMKPIKLVQDNVSNRDNFTLEYVPYTTLDFINKIKPSTHTSAHTQIRYRESVAKKFTKTYKSFKKARKIKINKLLELKEKIGRGNEEITRQSDYSKHEIFKPYFVKNDTTNLKISNDKYEIDKIHDVEKRDSKKNNTINENNPTNCVSETKFELFKNIDIALYTNNKAFNEAENPTIVLNAQTESKSMKQKPLTEIKYTESTENYQPKKHQKQTSCSNIIQILNDNHIEEDFQIRQTDSIIDKLSKENNFKTSNYTHDDFADILSNNNFELSKKKSQGSNNLLTIPFKSGSKVNIINQNSANYNFSNPSRDNRIIDLHSQNANIEKLNTENHSFVLDRTKILSSEAYNENTTTNNLTAKDSFEKNHTLKIPSLTNNVSSTDDCLKQYYSEVKAMDEIDFNGQKELKKSVFMNSLSRLEKRNENTYNIPKNTDNMSERSRHKDQNLNELRNMLGNGMFLKFKENDDNKSTFINRSNDQIKCLNGSVDVKIERLKADFNENPMDQEFKKTQNLLFSPADHMSTIQKESKTITETSHLIQNTYVNIYPVLCDPKGSNNEICDVTRLDNINSDKNQITYDEVHKERELIPNNKFFIQKISKIDKQLVEKDIHKERELIISQKPLFKKILNGNEELVDQDISKKRKLIISQKPLFKNISNGNEELVDQDIFQERKLIISQKPLFKKILNGDEELVGQDIFKERKLIISQKPFFKEISNEDYKTVDQDFSKEKELIISQKPLFKEILKCYNQMPEQNIHCESKVVTNQSPKNQRISDPNVNVTTPYENKQENEVKDSHSASFVDMDLNSSLRKHELFKFPTGSIPLSSNFSYDVKVRSVQENSNNAIHIEDELDVLQKPCENKANINLTSRIILENHSEDKADDQENNNIKHTINTTSFHIKNLSDCLENKNDEKKKKNCTDQPQKTQNNLSNLFQRDKTLNSTDSTQNVGSKNTSFDKVYIKGIHDNNEFIEQNDKKKEYLAEIQKKKVGKLINFFQCQEINENQNKLSRSDFYKNSKNSFRDKLKNHRSKKSENFDSMNSTFEKRECLSQGKRELNTKKLKIFEPYKHCQDQIKTNEFVQNQHTQGNLSTLNINDDEIHTKLVVNEKKFREINKFFGPQNRIIIKKGEPLSNSEPSKIDKKFENLFNLKDSDGRDQSSMAELEIKTNSDSKKYLKKTEEEFECIFREEIGTFEDITDDLFEDLYTSY